MRGKPFQKGHKGAKPKGAQNKTTAKARELILYAIDAQSEDFNATMLRIKRDNPVEWARLMCKLFDYVLPKKVDLTTDGEKIQQTIIWGGKEIKI